jgi:hypothetical protein
MSGYNDECGLRGISGFRHPDYTSSLKLSENLPDNQEIPTSNIDLADREAGTRPDEVVECVVNKDTTYTKRELEGDNQAQKLHNRDNVEEIAKQIKK